MCFSRVSCFLAVLCFVGSTVTGCKQSRPAETVIDISGKWTFTLTSSKGEKRFGSADVIQRPGEKEFSIAGKVENLDSGELEVAFYSRIAAINGREAFFIYENADREFGAAVAPIPGGRPKTLSFRYYDCIGFDKNNDPHGVLDMQRVVQEDEDHDED
jgi:hypothetical protein